MGHGWGWVSLLTGFAATFVPGIHQMQHGCCSFLDGTPGDVDHRPTAAGTEAACPEQFGFYSIVVDIFIAISVCQATLNARANQTQAVTANLDKGVSV
jgi:hypothetical protein